MTEDTILNRYLPKWPQMRVRGNHVTRDQAVEIIRRTDSAFLDLNPAYNDKNLQYLAQRLGLPGNMTWEAFDVWLDLWGYIRTEYVRNRWIASHFIFGPHGWCHPDGTILFVDNVGKWPSGTEVYNDWCVLAKEFPFLDLDVTLMSGEEGEENTTPVMGFRVRSGTVTVVDPTKEHLRSNDVVDVPRYGNQESALYLVGQYHALPPICP